MEEITLEEQIEFIDNAVMKCYNAINSIPNPDYVAFVQRKLNVILAIKKSLQSLQ